MKQTRRDFLKASPAPKRTLRSALLEFVKKQAFPGAVLVRGFVGNGRGQPADLLERLLRWNTDLYENVFWLAITFDYIASWLI